MAARSVLLAAVAALAARPLAATPGRLATGGGCARSITSGNMMGTAISVTGASTQIQLAKGGNTIACGGTLTAGDTGLTLVKGSISSGSTGSLYRECAHTRRRGRTGLAWRPPAAPRRSS